MVEPVLTKKPETKNMKPRMYKVLVLNDDYTSFDFVVKVLTTIFHKTSEEAHTITLQVHRKGVGLAGIYTHEIAETKILESIELAHQNGFPLKLTMEQE